MDYFEALGLERKASLGEEEIKEAFHELSRERHPDVAGADGGFAIVAEAYAVLRDPVRRLRHLLETEFGDEKGREDRRMISGDLLELFGVVGETIQRAEDFLKGRAACRTALGRAMLTEEETVRQRELANLSVVLNDVMDKSEARLAEVDREMRSDRERAHQLGEELAQRMSYLSKWIQEVREKFAAFI